MTGSRPGGPRPACRASCRCTACVISYVSHLIEDGVDPLFVQLQAGHSWASTTAAYTTVGQDARNKMLRAALARAFGEGDRG
jgi:integrase/recombinase XerC